ncbi:recombination protein RecR [soil metagenome]
MQLLPKSLEELIESLGTLPGVGPRTAERYAYFILKSEPSVAQRLGNTANQLHDGVGVCKKTFALVEVGTEISPLYSASDRDKTTIAVVADPFDIIALEKTRQFKGTYHVLGGLLSPIDGLGPEDLHIPELLQRIKEDKVKEIILATNASVEGESTALYIQKHIDDTDIITSRLARGLPVGIDLDYADQVTLGRALEGRTKL